MLLLQLSVASFATCPTPSATADLIASLDAAKAAFADLDVPSFRAAVARMEVQLPCTSDEVTRELSAEIHRMQGLLAFANQSPDRAQSAFAAARGIEPEYRFPETLVPAGNPLLSDYSALAPVSTQTAVPAPGSGVLLFDGQLGGARPDHLPVLFQHINGEGTVAITSYLWPNDPLPGYPLSDTNPSGRGRTRRSMFIGAISSAVLSGGLYTSAFLVNQRYYDSPKPLLQREGLRDTNNGLVVASGAALGLALGLGTTGLAVGSGR